MSDYIDVVEELRRAVALLELFVDGGLGDEDYVEIDELIADCRRIPDDAKHYVELGAARDA